MSFGGGRGNGKDFKMDDFDFEGFGEQENAETQFGQQSGFPQMPGNGEMPDFGQMPPNGFGGEMPGGDEKRGGFGGGFGGMGSDDVKLKYIDDDPDSYSNIFGSAKTDASSADEKRLIAALKNLSEYTDLENTLDLEEVLRYFVVHNFVVNGDSYTGSMIHNYYLHEKDGKLGMIPWDYNLAFGTFQGGSASSSVNDSIDEALSDRPMQAWIFSDESYTQQYHTLFSKFLDEWFSNGELASMIEDTAAMLRPYVEKDPTKFCTAEEFEKGVTALSEFITLRAEAVSRQLSGDNTAVDTAELNLSDMGTMGGGFGGGMPGRPGGMDDAPQDMEQARPDGGGDFGGERPDRGEWQEMMPPENASRPDGMERPERMEEPGTSGRTQFPQPGEMPGGMPGNPFEQGAAPGGIGNAQQTLVLLGVSVLVLAAGLIFAIKFKV